MINYEGQEVTLEQILDNKEKRKEKQLLLLNNFKQKNIVLVCFTVVMPGKVKQNNVSSIIFDEGCKEFEDNLKINKIKLLKKETENKITGNEAFYILEGKTPEEIKKDCIKLEESSNYSRLWDFDVISKDGNIISREQLGYKERKCLICDETSRVCYKKRTHSLFDLKMKVLDLASQIKGSNYE
ncbi:MAG: citrate lyase holo-[acyl-carrier protein] synthase [Sphaerochaetaceae bacterium]|nr:citrate lyase holo-[acyl-carrier protein] synthase [Sphaerochaetaceae bacterium]